MMKSAFALLIALLASPGAFAQNPPSSGVPPQTNKTKNVWAGDNFEQVCTITATGSPGTFTPTCPSNNITITAAGQTIALPTVGTPPGFQPGGVTKSVELNIFYAAPYVPTFASGYAWTNGGSPAQCTTSVTAGCLAGVISSNPDLIECRTAGETLVRCGSPLTTVSTTTPRLFVQGKIGAQASGSSTATVTLTSPATAGQSIFCITSGNGGPGSVSDDAGNSYTQIDTLSASDVVSEFAKIGVTGAPHTITATGLSNNAQIGCDVFSGISTIVSHVPAYQASPGTGTDAITTGAGSITGAPGDIVYGATSDGGCCGGNPTSGTGFTTASTDPGTGGLGSAMGTEYKTMAGASTAATFTSSLGIATYTFGMDLH